MSNGGDRDSRLSTKWAPPTSLIPKKNEAGNSWKFNSTKWFGYPSFQLKVKIIDCLQNDGTRFFSTKRLGFYGLQGSRLLSFTQKTVKKNICSEHESYQMVEDMATPMKKLGCWPFALGRKNRKVMKHAEESRLPNVAKRCQPLRLGSNNINHQNAFMETTRVDFWCLPWILIPITAAQVQPTTATGQFLVRLGQGRIGFQDGSMMLHLRTTQYPADGIPWVNFRKKKNAGNHGIHGSSGPKYGGFPENKGFTTGWPWEEYDVISKKSISYPPWL